MSNMGTINNISMNSYVDSIKSGNAIQYTPAIWNTPVDSFEPSVNKVQDENKNKKNKLLNFAKIAVVASAVAFLIFKHKSSEAKKLAQTIQFEKASTVEEAIKFAKKNLGIKEFEGFSEKDLDVLNWFNEGVVNVSNKMNGKLRMPRKIIYSTDTRILPDASMAGVYNNPDSPFYGNFHINKNFYDNIDSWLDRVIDAGINKRKVLVYDGPNIKVKDVFRIEDTDELLVKYQAKTLTFNEKVQLFGHVRSLIDKRKILSSVPMPFIKEIVNKANLRDIKFANGVTITDIEKMGPKEQIKYFNALIDELKKRGIKFQIDMPQKDQFNTIYHEFGHLQDMQLRCQAKEKFADPSQYPDELKKWFANKKDLETANLVSTYATSGPGEFIAETYARAIHGAKITDEVVELYKKLKGPRIPGVL